MAQTIYFIKSQGSHRRMKKGASKYVGNPTPVKRIKDRKLKAKIRKTDANYARSGNRMVEYERIMGNFFTGGEKTGLYAENEMEKTYRISQDELKRTDIDIQTKTKMFDLTLDSGPYLVDYSLNGRSLILGGRKGHISVFNWISKRLNVEFDVEEEVNDIKFVQAEELFAVAQKKYVYIYDKKGTEIHRLFKHIHPYALEYLSYHFLLCSIGRSGVLKYQDLSTGEIIAEHRTKSGPCGVITQNPSNGVILLGHVNGVISMWTPNQSNAAVKLLSHKGAVNGVAVSASGRYLTSVGSDSKMRIYDLRKTYKELFTYRTNNPGTLSVSQKGMIAVGNQGATVEIWRDAFIKKQENPYMKVVREGSQIEDISFCPYEDILGIGYSNGFRSSLVPGSSETSFDSFEQNPYETRRMARESTVKKLLDKIPSGMISLDERAVGTIDKVSDEVKRQTAKEEYEATHKGEKYEDFLRIERKNKVMGKSIGKKRYKRKQENVIAVGRELKKRRDAEELEAGADNTTTTTHKDGESGFKDSGMPSLSRFITREVD